MNKTMTAAIAAMVTCAAPASAAPILIAQGALGGTSDLSGLTGTLENGVAANALGGLGSGLAYAGGNRFLALSDRGPNATPYNPLVDNTTSYIARFQSLTLDLTPQAGGLPFALTPTLTGTKLLSSADPLAYGTGAGLGVGPGAPTENGVGRYYFTGRSDGFGAGNSGAPGDARFDPEGIRVSNDGVSVFVSDEYGPYVRQFDSATGQLIRTFTLPAKFDVAVKSAQGALEEKPYNATGRVDNKGMEGLAITPDGKTLVGIMQQPLLQDSSKVVRIVTIDIATGATHEYGYKLTTGSSVSEIVAVNDHQFLVDERDGKGYGDGSNAAVKSVFLVDLAGATDISGVAATNNTSTPTVAKSATPFLDVFSQLTTTGGLTAAQVPAKIESLAFGQDVTLNGALLHTLFVGVDNDFVPQTAGPTSSTSSASGTPICPASSSRRRSPRPGA